MWLPPPQASFRQWQLRHALPQLEQRLAELSAAKDAVAVPQEEQVGPGWYELLQLQALCSWLRSHGR